MKALTVLYDGQCGLCRRARDWLELQPKFVALEFVSARSAQARHIVPDLTVEDLLRDLTVVGSDGAVYRAEKAWIMCLWALRRHRGWALRLAAPALLPYAKRLIDWLSKNRFRFFRPREIGLQMASTNPSRS